MGVRRGRWRCAARAGWAPASALVALAGAAMAAAAAPAEMMVTFIDHPADGRPTVVLESAGGSARTLGPAADARLAPDGSTVAAVRAIGAGRQAGDAVVLYSTGSAPVRMLLRTRRDPSPAAWSPDSRYVAVIEFDRLVVIDTRSGAAPTIARGEVTAVSFSPDGTDRLTFDLSPPGAPASDLFVSAPDGSVVQALTDDAHSAYPLWGPRGIVFTRETARAGTDPLYELWSIRADGTHARQMTHVPAGRFNDGLVPVAFSADGRRLLANFEGTDTVEAWAIDLGGPIALPRDLTAEGSGTIGIGLSHDGRTVLAEHGYGGDTPAHWGIETIPWRGGAPRSLAAHGAFPSWNA